MNLVDVQHDGQLYEKKRDPPGQKSFYIMPGNESSESYRLTTFVKFPVHEVPVNPVQLSQAGFFFTGYKDRVKCFSCGVTVENWKISDDPLSANWHKDTCLHKDGKDSRNIGRNSIHKIWKSFNSKNTFYEEPTTDLATFQTYIPPGNELSEKYRLGTFCSFPARVVEGSALAINGFMYTGNKTKIKCFCCGIVLSNIVPRDSGKPEYHKADCAHILHSDSDAYTHNEPLDSLQSYRKMVKRDAVPTPNSSVDETKKSLEFENNKNKSSSGNSGALYQSARPKFNHDKPKISLGRVDNKQHRPLLASLDLYKEEDRKRTFVNAPASLHAVGIDNLAATGFFYLGDTDRTQCFSCGGILRRWEGADSPYCEHRANFPSCSMVKGENRLNVPSWSAHGTGEGVPEPAGPARESMRQQLKIRFPCKRPHTADMASYEARLRSFIGRWPMADVKATPEQIARAGFFCLGDRDKAKCWYCNGGLQNWDFNDEPWTEHAKWFPGCEFVLQQKGTTFVLPVIRNSPSIVRPKISNGVPINDIVTHDAEMTGVRRQVSAGDLLMGANFDPNRPTNPARLRLQVAAPASSSQQQAPFLAQSSSFVLSSSSSADPPAKKKKQTPADVRAIMDKAKELGFSDIAISKASVSKDNFTLHEILDILLKETEKQRSEEESEEEEEESEEDESEDYESGGDVPPPSSTKTKRKHKVNKKTARSKTSEMETKLERLKQERMCRVCKREQADQLLIPCGHIAFCHACVEREGAAKPERCPICSRKIERFIRTYPA